MGRRLLRVSVIALLGALLLFAFAGLKDSGTQRAEAFAPATLFTVNSTADLPDADPTDGACATAPPNSVCTLRAAVMQANGHTGVDTILVPAGTYLITCAGYDANAACGDLDVTDGVTIQSSGGMVTIDANGNSTADRAFEVINASLTLVGPMTIQNGNTPSYGGAIYAHGSGSLQLSGVTVQNNTAAFEGGGIYASSPNIQISSSTIQGNKSQQSGGGISVEGSGTPYPVFSISDSTIANNQALAGSAGGGLNASTTSGSIQDSTFQNNSANTGGAANYTGSVVGVQLGFTNTLIISNTATGTDGGGLYLYGHTTLANTQVLSNSAQSAGGIYAYFGTHDLSDVRVSYNKATSFDCGGIEVSSGNLNMNRGWVESNSAPDVGGGLCTGGAGTIRLVITDTNVLNNSAGMGGGIYASNTFIASRSAIYNNFATRGGGIYAYNFTTVDNSTVSGNSAVRDGGGIYADPSSTVQLNSATLESNHAHTAPSGAGIGGGVYISSTAVVSSANTLIGDNTNSNTFISYSDCNGTLRSEGYNFISTNSGCAGVVNGTNGDQVGGSSPFGLIDPKVDPLAWLTGLTPGHALHSDSPLINAANPGGCQSALPPGFLFVDQIGHSRLSNRCDIGALEYFNFGAKTNQTISFPSIPDKHVSDSPFTLNATASSGLSVTYVIAGMCHVSGNSVTFSIAGSCAVTAHQSGDGTYNPAQDVSQVFVIQAGGKLYLPAIFR